MTRSGFPEGFGVGVTAGSEGEGDRWADVPRINVPTLVIAGAKGTMNPDDIRRMGKLIPRARVVITNGSHLEMYDDQQTYFRELVKFIKDVEAGKL